MPHKIALFNHKGGVGKTTMTANIAIVMANYFKKNVLMLDLDSQCNLTSYFISEDYMSTLLDQSEGPAGNTIWSGLAPIVNNEGLPKKIDVIPIIPDRGSGSLDMLAGDIRIARFEQELVQYWSDAFQRKPKGFRGITAISELIEEQLLNKAYDIILFDLSPSIGALSKTCILDCSHLVMPVACDLFSKSSIKTLGQTLLQWFDDMDLLRLLNPKEKRSLQGEPLVCGYLAVGIKTYRKEPTKSFETMLSDLDTSFETEIARLLAKKYPRSVRLHGRYANQLGYIKDFPTLASLAQMQGRALYEVSSPSVSQGQKEDAFGNIVEICTELNRRLGE